MIKRLVEFLRPIGVKRISIFGSFARGDDQPGSDIDVLVELKPEGQRPVLGFRWFSLSEEATNILGRRIDIVSDRAINDRFRRRIESDLRVIYEEVG